MAGREFWQNNVAVVRGQRRAAGDGRYGTLEFEGKTSHRIVGLHLQHGFVGMEVAVTAPLKTIAGAPECCQNSPCRF